MAKFSVGGNSLAPWGGETVPTDLWISYTPPSWGRLDRDPLPETLRVHLPLDARGNLVAASPDRPPVYATLGSIYGTAHKLMRSFIRAVELGGWQGLVTVGRNNDAARFQHPASIQVLHHVSQADVLPAASVVLCHGGFGSPAKRNTCAALCSV